MDMSRGVLINKDFSELETNKTKIISPNILQSAVYILVFLMLTISAWIPCMQLHSRIPG